MIQLLEVLSQLAQLAAQLVEHVPVLNNFSATQEEQTVFEPKQELQGVVQATQLEPLR